jgi:hypothetical protein
MTAPDNSPSPSAAAPTPWDGDRQVRTEHINDDGTRNIIHTVYEPNSFTPLIGLSTTTKGSPKAKPGIMIQMGMPGALESLPEQARGLMQETFEQIFQGNILPLARSIMIGMGMGPDQMVATIKQEQQQIEQQEQSRWDSAER